MTTTLSSSHRAAFTAVEAILDWLPDWSRLRHSAYHHVLTDAAKSEPNAKVEWRSIEVDIRHRDDCLASFHCTFMRNGSSGWDHVYVKLYTIGNISSHMEFYLARTPRGAWTVHQLKRLCYSHQQLAPHGDVIPLDGYDYDNDWIKPLVKI